jgi:hypothetical protein
MKMCRNRFLGAAALAALGSLVLAPAGAATPLVSGRSAAGIAACATQTEPGQQAATPCAGLPPGKHSLLERFTAAFGLTCEQQLKIEPLLHSEESVSKPLLRFPAFSPEERQAVMLKIKIAARRQIRTLLAPDQQLKMDEEIASVSKGADKASGGNSRGSSKQTSTDVDPFESEESLSQAILNYSALSADEKKALVLQVKLAARRDNAPPLKPEQQRKIDSDVRQLSGK